MIVRSLAASAISIAALDFCGFSLRVHGAPATGQEAA
jgi:hypothetical protein